VEGCAREGEGIELPYRMRISPGNVLFVQGREYRSDVSITWEPGDSVRINGLAVFPVPKPPPKQIPENDLENTYGAVPFIVDLVEQGETWREAAHQYNSRRRAFDDKALRVYGSVFEITGSKDVATEAVVDSMDRLLLDPAFEIRHGDATVVVKWDGLPWEASYYLHENYLQSKVVAEPRELVGKEEVIAFIQSIAKRLEGRGGGTWMEVISTSHITFGGRKVQEALDQIEDAVQGKPSDGPIPDSEVELIVGMRRGVQN
ncbi:MAG: hypothetical protein ABIJ00_03995, partial [Candidatus Eisenbacteria bacterium]